MSTAYSRPEDLRRKLRTLGDEWTNAELQEECEEAHRILPSLVGSKFIERKTIYDADQTVYELVFQPILSFDRVEKNGRIVDSSDYVVDKDAGTVTWNSSDDLGDGDVLHFYYVPLSFRDVEILLALESVITNMVIDTGSQELEGRLQTLRAQTNRKIGQINRRGALFAAPDHKRRF